MICVLGDIHFRDDKDFFVKTCEEFLLWFKNNEYNNVNNTLILLGDLVERPVMTGRVAEYLERFIKYSNFKDIHIIVGNHDIKKQYGVEQLAYQFFENKEHIHIHYECEKFVVENKSLLAMPHFNNENEYGQNLVDFYSSLYEKPSFQEHYDYAFGHFNCDDISFGGQAVSLENISKIDCNHIILGHIHTRYINPDNYLGSVFAGKKGENDDNRCMLVIDGDTEKEVMLPKFNEFIDVYYPEQLPYSNAIVPIYTIYNCSSESIAKNLYGDKYFRKVLKSETSFSTSNNTDNSKKISNSMNIKDIMNELFLTRSDISQNIKNICNRVVV